jgi:hypothetical protein
MMVIFVCLSKHYMIHVFLVWKLTTLSVAGMLNKCLCLARALGMTKLKNMSDMILATLCWAT